MKKLKSLSEDLFKTLEKNEMKSIKGGTSVTYASIRTFVPGGGEQWDTVQFEDDKPGYGYA